MVVKVLFLYDIESENQKYFQTKLNDLLETKVQLIFFENNSQEKASEYIEEVDMIVGWRPKKEVLEKATRLVLFNSPGAGIQHLVPIFKELNQKREKPILLANCHGNAYFTAQTGVALMMTLMSKILQHHIWLKNGRWRTDDENAKSIPLRHKTIGLLGYGAVNQNVHKFLSGFDVNFVICKRTPMKEPESSLSIEKSYTIDQLQSFLKETDILIIAIPLTEETTGLLGKKELKLLGSEGIIVNIGRGALIKQQDLYEALKNNTIQGAAIDVWYNYDPEEKEGKKYPYDEKHPFHKLDNIVLSPHRAASPEDDLERWDDILYNIREIVEGRGKFKNIVDLERGY